MAKKTTKILPHPEVNRSPVCPGCLPADVEIGKTAKDEPIIAKRVECKKVFTMDDGTKVCMAYIDPSVYWDKGNCPLASNIIDVIEEKRKMLNPIKKSKRKGR